MAAIVRDLSVLNRPDGPWLEFSWVGNSAEWHFALDAIKSIPPEAREYDPDEKVWRVAAAFEDELGEIFPNFPAALDAIRSQMSLFGEGDGGSEAT